MIGTANIDNTVAILGYDLFQNERWNTASKPRVIRGIACAGSTAIADFEFDLFIGLTLIGHFLNTRAGVLAPLQEDIIPLGLLNVPVGAKISGIVTNAAVGNPVHLIVY